MINLYKKYHVAYWCIGSILIICMVVAMFLLWNTFPAAPFLVFFPTVLLVIINAIVFTVLTNKKLNNEVLVLFNNCQANKYINELQTLFKGKADKGVNVSIYNTLLSKGYAVIDDYDLVYECCQKIKARNYQTEKSRSMIEYYITKNQIELAQNEIEKLRKMAEKLTQSKYKEGCEISIKNAEYSIRIRQGNFEGAEEHYLKMLDTIKPLYPITEASYSYALGRLFVLKGEPLRAKDYLQKAIDLGGDTKYCKKAEEELLALQEDSEKV